MATFLEIPRLRSRSVLEQPPPLTQLNTAPPAAPGARAGEALQAVSGIAAEALRQKTQDVLSAAGLAVADARARWTTELSTRMEKAPLGAPDFTATYLSDLDNESSQLIAAQPTRQAKDYVTLTLTNLKAGLADDARRFETESRTRRITTEQGEAFERSTTYLRQRPGEYESLLEVHRAHLEVSGLSAEEQDAIQRSGTRQLALAAVAGLIERDPAAIMKGLSALPGESGVPAIEALSAADREAVRTEAESRFEGNEAGRILTVYRADFRAGARALTALEASGLPLERQDGIRRKVSAGVGLLRDERRQVAVDELAAAERAVTSGTDMSSTLGRLDNLYRRGALSPAEYADLQDRTYRAARTLAEDNAVTGEIANAIASGVPLDPSSERHRDFLDRAFTTDAGSAAPGSSPWQALALTYASQTRLLPRPAGAWLRQAARSPDATVAVTASQFYGALETTSPEAAGNLDTDTKAFLGVLGGMLSAGAEPKAAFETARANVYDTRRDVVEGRRQQYTAEAKANAGALDAFIDADFDTAFSAQPGASTGLRADFDSQAGAYFEKTGDIALARELAWRDLRRIYGASSVNGDPIITAFPVERFGVTAEEVRREIGPDALLVPDSLTLRLVQDALTGKPVMPSYRLVTKEGDLVTGADGVPLRYTLPGGEELTRRIEERQKAAAAETEASVERVRERRRLLREAEELNREPSRLIPRP